MFLLNLGNRKEPEAYETMENKFNGTILTSCPG